jgi:hypothetical protein
MGFLPKVGICFLLAPWGRIPSPWRSQQAGAIDLLVFSEKNIDTSAQFGLFRCMYGFFIGYVVHRITVAKGTPWLRGQRTASAFEFACIVAIAVFVALLGMADARTVCVRSCDLGLCGRAGGCVAPVEDPGNRNCRPAVVFDLTDPSDHHRDGQ